MEHSNVDVGSRRYGMKTPTGVPITQLVCLLLVLGIVEITCGEMRRPVIHV